MNHCLTLAINIEIQLKEDIYPDFFNVAARRSEKRQIKGSGFS